MPERLLKETPPVAPPIVVASCIDFRTVEKLRQELQDTYGLQDGDYSLLSTAGAALNPATPELVTHGEISRFLNFNHRDCGFAKATGSDDHHRHHQSMEGFGAKLMSKIPFLQFHPHIIEMADDDQQRHTCDGLAIIKGLPQIVKGARSLLDQVGFKDDHDEIARTGDLATDHTVWSDFGISLRLHNPRKVFIFDNDQKQINEVAQRAEREARKLNRRLDVIPVFMPA